jgi:hypothetical protein
MKNTQIYLLTLNSPSQTALRLWTGRSLHTLRHCSAKQVSGALVEMQKNVDALQESMGILKQVKKDLTAVPEAGVRATKQNAPASKQITRFADQHSNRRTSKEVQQATIGRRQRHGGFFRNVGQKGGSQ